MTRKASGVQSAESERMGDRSIPGSRTPQRFKSAPTAQPMMMGLVRIFLANFQTPTLPPRFSSSAVTPQRLNSGIDTETESSTTCIS